MGRVPFWDTVWAADLVVLFGIIVAVIIYSLQQHGSKHRQQQSTLAHLKGVKTAIEGFAPFFSTSYEGGRAEHRAQRDYDLVMAGLYMQNYKVPTEPVASLIEPPGDAWPIESKTSEAAGTALMRLTHFNQLVQQQADFNALHAAEIRRSRMNHGDRLATATAARGISAMLHGSVIEDASWYQDLISAIDDNIEILERLLAPSWRKVLGADRTDRMYVWTPSLAQVRRLVGS